MTSQHASESLCNGQKQILTFIRSDWNDARGAANQVIQSLPSVDLIQAIRQTRRMVDCTFAKLQNAESLVAHLETQLKLLGDRWDASSTEYQDVKRELGQRKYRRVLDELEHLIVQRLFELTKLNVSGTGEIDLFTRSQYIDMCSYRLQDAETDCQSPATTI
jgi:hypothetical protein